MLQRAASNAYSWWWASHIRTKQSKWLEQHLQDMEEKVKSTLDLLQDEGDSFAKRAEFYYRKRPELINFVEESLRAYKALAERYNHISGELQNANNTIATVFPEQVQFMEEDDEDNSSPRPRPVLNPNKLVEKPPPEPPKPNIPKVPKIPKKDVKGLLTLPTKNIQAKSTPSISTPVTSSRISIAEALSEIDKLQKGILALQTEKEFVKGSYESSLAKYCEIEKQIEEMQDEVCSLQEEFSVNTFIEDDEARSLMAATALKSCHESLIQLLEKQESSADEARLELQRLQEAKKKFETLKSKFLPNTKDQQLMTKKEDTETNDSGLEHTEKEVEKLKAERDSICEKIKEHFETDHESSLTVTELAEKIDGLVTKIISLEGAVSSQNALIKRLRSETTEVHTNLHQLEDEKSTIIHDSNALTEKLKKLEVDLNGIHDLNKNVEDQNNNLQTYFTEARCHIDHLTEKLKNVRPDDEEEEEDEEEEDADEEEEDEDEDEEEVEIPKDSVQIERTISLNGKSPLDVEFPSVVESHTEVAEVKETGISDDDLVKMKATETENVGNISHGAKNPEETHEKSNITDALNVLKPENHESPSKIDEVENKDSSETRNIDLIDESSEQDKNQEPEVDWKKLYLHGLEDREKILLDQYTSILRNFKDAKKMNTELEKKNREALLERIVQIRDLKNANATKDEEIRCLRQKLNIIQGFEGNADTYMAENEGSEKKLSHDNTEEELKSSEQNDEATTRTEESSETKTAETPAQKQEEEIKTVVVDEPQVVSPLEGKFRTDIDELLEENLEFWLRFSTSFHQIQKFQTSIEDLQGEISKLKEKKQESSSKDGSSKEGHSGHGSHRSSRSLKSDARPIYKHLREIQTELTVWLEKGVLLKEELQCRFSNLCDIQEEISKVLSVSGKTDGNIELTNVQAAKFQGEILNMKQENNKVADELQAGLDHVNSLNLEIEKTLSKLNDEYKLGASSKSQSKNSGSSSNPRIPLRSFLFGSKPKSKKSSMFLCINPALHKHHHSGDLADKLPP